jgi:hypothetical protein
MAPITCGAFLRRTLPSHRPATGEMFGAVVAENQLIRATLRTIENINWHFWVPITETSLTVTPQHSEGLPNIPDLTLLQREFPGRVFLSPLAMMREIVTADDYLFVAGLPLLPRLSEVQQRLGLRRHPICGLVHAVSVSDLYWQFTRIAMSLSDLDTIVAPSATGRTSVEKLLTRNWIIPSRTGLSSN